MPTLLQRAGLDDANWRRFLAVAGAVSLLVHVVDAWLQQGVHHCDEHFQVLEWLGVLQGTVKPEELTWEYAARIRSWTQPMLYAAVVLPLRVLGILEDPFATARLLRVLSSCWGWLGSMGMALACGRWFPDAWTRRVTALLILCCSSIVYVHGRTSSENLSQGAFHLAVAALVLGASGGKRVALSWRAGMLAGALLGLAFCLRFQTGFLVAGTGLWLLVHAERRIHAVLSLFLGFVCTFLGGLLLDHAGYGEWTVPAYNYFSDQVLHNGAAKFGENPWWFYLQEFPRGVPGALGIVILLGGLASWVRMPGHVLVWAGLPFLLGHMLVGHKEGRFLFPMLGTLLVPLGAMLPRVPLTTTGLRMLSPAGKAATALLGLAALLDVGTTVRLPFTIRPWQMATLEDVRAKMRDGGPLYLLGTRDDPFTDCGIQMRFYKPRGMEMRPVANVEEALQQSSPAIIYRELSGVPVDQSPDPRCTRFSSNQPLHVPDSLAAKAWVPPLFAGHLMHEGWECTAAGVH